MKLCLPEIRHDRSGFEALVCLYVQTKDCIFDDIDIDMGATTWFDADMCAAFGAILYRFGDNVNTVSLTNIRSGVEQIPVKKWIS